MYVRLTLLSCPVAGLFVPMNRISKTTVHLTPRDKKRSNGGRKGRDRLSVGTKAVEQTTTDLEVRDPGFQNFHYFIFAKVRAVGQVYFEIGTR